MSRVRVLKYRMITVVIYRLFRHTRPSRARANKAPAVYNGRGVSCTRVRRDIGKIKLVPAVKFESDKSCVTDSDQTVLDCTPGGYVFYFTINRYQRYCYT